MARAGRASFAWSRRISTSDVPPLDPYVWSPAGPNLVNQYEMFWTEGNPAEGLRLAGRSRARNFAADIR